MSPFATRLVASFIGFLGIVCLYGGIGPIVMIMSTGTSISSAYEFLYPFIYAALGATLICGAFYVWRSTLRVRHKSIDL